MLREEVAGMAEEAESRPRALRRRRRANVTGGRRHRHEVWVSPEEELALLSRADEAHVTVPRLLVESALAPAGETSSERRELAAEFFRAVRLLAALSNNVNQMAKATNATGEVGRELSATVGAVRECALRIRATLEGYDAR